MSNTLYNIAQANYAAQFVSRHILKQMQRELATGNTKIILTDEDIQKRFGALPEDLKPYIPADSSTFAKTVRAQLTICKPLISVDEPVLIGESKNRIVINGEDAQMYASIIHSTANELLEPIKEMLSLDIGRVLEEINNFFDNEFQCDTPHREKILKLLQAIWDNPNKSHLLESLSQLTVISSENTEQYLNQAYEVYQKTFKYLSAEQKKEFADILPGISETREKFTESLQATLQDALSLKAPEEHLPALRFLVSIKNLPPLLQILFSKSIANGIANDCINKDTDIDKLKENLEKEIFQDSNLQDCIGKEQVKTFKRQLAASIDDQIDNLRTKATNKTKPTENIEETPEVLRKLALLKYHYRKPFFKILKSVLFSNSFGFLSTDINKVLGFTKDLCQGEIPHEDFIRTLHTAVNKSQNDTLKTQIEQKLNEIIELDMNGTNINKEFKKHEEELHSLLKKLLTDKEKEHLKHKSIAIGLKEFRDNGSQVLGAGTSALAFPFNLISFLTDETIDKISQEEFTGKTIVKLLKDIPAGTLAAGYLNNLDLIETALSNNADLSPETVKDSIKFIRENKDSLLAFCQDQTTEKFKNLFLDLVGRFDPSSPPDITKDKLTQEEAQEITQWLSRHTKLLSNLFGSQFIDRVLKDRDVEFSLEIFKELTSEKELKSILNDKQLPSLILKFVELVKNKKDPSKKDLLKGFWFLTKHKKLGQLVGSTITELPTTYNKSIKLGSGILLAIGGLTGVLGALINYSEIGTNLISGIGSFGMGMSIGSLAKRFALSYLFKMDKGYLGGFGAIIPAAISTIVYGYGASKSEHPVKGFFLPLGLGIIGAAFSTFSDTASSAVGLPTKINLAKKTSQNSNTPQHQAPKPIPEPQPV